MKNEIIYLPILKGKQGEYGALKNLNDEQKNAIIPLIEIPPIPWNFVNEKPSTTVNNQIKSSIKNIVKSWDKNLPIIIDTNSLADTTEDGRFTLNEIMIKLMDEGFSPTPVIYPGIDRKLLDELIIKEDVCIRIYLKDLDDFDEIKNEIKQLIDAKKLKYKNIYLLLDMSYCAIDEYILIQNSIALIINNINNIKDFKELFFSITSFPVNLSSCPGNNITTIERIETKVYKHIQKTTSLIRKPKYSDYGIAHPYIEDIDPRFMVISASIRYTHEDYWYIFKGRSLKKYTYDQFYDLSKTVVNYPIYCGEKFSWGDNEIYNKSKKIGGTGNPSVWRQIGTNHHLAFMINLLSS